MSPTEQAERRPAPTIPKRIPSPPIAAVPLAPAPVVPVRNRSSLRRAVTAIIIISLLAVGAVVAVKFWLDSRQYEWTDDAIIDGHIISISPQVSARVLSVSVNDNQQVKKGDVLVQLDPTDFQVVLDQRKATEDSMRGKLQQAGTQLEVAKANVGEAKAELDVAMTNALNTDQDYQRMLGLDTRARSQQQMDNTTAAQRSAAATVGEAKAKVAAAEAQVMDAQAFQITTQSDVDKAVADRHQAEIQLGYCVITAPEDGVITRKAIEAGMYVTVGQPLFSIVPSDVWITANFKETQLDFMRPGQPVLVVVDAYPEKTYQGHVQSIQSGTGSKFTLLPPENATGNFVKVVQRVPVKIVFDPGQVEGLPLSPGMSAEPKVKVRSWESLSALLGF
jgi:membrane fusion protein, multidrug efflux system